MKQQDRSIDHLVSIIKKLKQLDNTEVANAINEKQIRKKLKAKGLPDEEVDKTLNTIKEISYHVCCGIVVKEDL